MKRPEITPEIIKTGVQRLSEQENRGWSEKHIKAVVESYYMDINGYELAKRLDDDYGWDVDAELVGQLDELTSYVREAHKEAQEEWVKANNITPKFNAGDRVCFMGAFSKVTGTIDGIYEHMPARYIFKEDGRLSDSHRLIVPFEDVELLETA